MFNIYNFNFDLVKCIISIALFIGVVIANIITYIIYGKKILKTKYTEDGEEITTPEVKEQVKRININRTIFVYGILVGYFIISIILYLS